MGDVTGKLPIVVLVIAFAASAMGVVPLSNKGIRGLLLRAGEEEAVLSDAQRQLLKTLDQLRLPDVEKLRLVERVNSQEEVRCDLVVWQGGNKYTLLMENFSSESYQHYEFNPRILDHELDLIEHATKLLEEAHQTKSIELDGYLGSVSIPRNAARLPFWAWVCWRNGNHKLAGELLAEFERLYNTNPIEEFTQAEDPKKMNHAEWLLESVGRAKHRQLMERFSDLKVSRGELLAECLWFAETFPRSFYHQPIVEFIFELKRMLPEDEEHTKSARPFEQLRRHEQIAELIFQLRNQNGYHPGGGWANILGTGVEDNKTPADQLVEFGYDAIPQLIEALDNHRVTRLVGYYGTYSGDVVRVSGCALAILEEVTGRLLEPTETYDEKIKAHIVTATVADNYRDWYSVFLQKGERQLWIEGTENGDRNSLRQAKKLAKKYPASAVRAIRRGILRSQSFDSLIHVLADIPGDEALSALLDETVHSSFTSRRIQAAKAITLRGRDEGIKAMLLELADERIPRATDISPDKESFFHHPEQHVLDFLFHVGRVEVIEAIERQVVSKSEKKHSFLRSICDFSFEFLPNSPADPDQNWDELRVDFTDRDPPELLKEAVERLLVNLLDDSEAVSNMSILHGYLNDSERIEVRDPQAKDVAMFELHRLDPERYPFTKAEFESEPTEVALRFKNAWEKFLATNNRDSKAEPRQTIITLPDRLRSRTAAQQPKSEQQELIEATELGNPDSVSKAEELVLKYPAVAIPALQIGVIRSLASSMEFANFGNPEVSASLVALMGRVVNDDSLLALLEEAEVSSVIQARISAAGALLRRGRIEGLRAILAEWNGQRLTRVTDRDAFFTINKDRELTTFLSRCGRVDAIKELERGLQIRSTEKRLELLMVFSEFMESSEEVEPREEEQKALQIVDAYSQGPIALFSSKDTSADWKSAVEAMFITLLDDTSADQRFTVESPLNWKMKDSRGEEKEWQIDQPRVSDIASIILSALCPDKYSFSDTDFRSNRERVRIDLKNVWRKSRGQEPLPRPEP